MKSMDAIGRVYLVGAGPGDPELITVRGLKLLRTADVVLFDRLIAIELLASAEAAELIDVGKSPGSHRMTQTEINALIVAHALAGRTVVRLKGGDPLTFGRGMEELDVCREHDIPCDIVPGVSSVHSVPAAAGIPLTHRGIARSYAVITGQTRDGELPDHDFAALSKIDTLVVLMGLARLGEITQRLRSAGRAPSTPVAVIASGTTLDQRTVTGTLATITDIAKTAKLESPAITVIGAVAAFARGNPPRAIDECMPPSGLKGQRVVVTQAETTSTHLQRLLLDRGATVINVPLIQITYPAPSQQMRNAIGALKRGEFDVIALTSVHGVRGLANAMLQTGIRIDEIPRVTVAALGPGTANEARRLGFDVTIIPPRAMAEDLVVAIDEHVSTAAGPNVERSVLFPKSSRALPTLPGGLASRGFRVTDPIAYETIDAEATDEHLASLQDSFDAILFCSPSAVQRFVSLNVSVRDAIVGCIGPTTADAATRCGLGVDIVPDPPGSAGLVAALTSHMTKMETLSCHQ